MLIATDPLSLVFIACFLFGLLFLLVTAFMGDLGHEHAIGHGDGFGHSVGHHVHIGSVTHTHGAVHGTHGHAHTGQSHAPTQQDARAGAASSAQSNQFSLLNIFNPMAIVLFLLWFGFFGYVLHNTTNLILPLALVLACVGGVIIAGFILNLLSRVFKNSEGTTIQDVADRTGLVGKVNTTIRENGIGEITYISPGGMRKSIPARSIDGQRIERDQEVVVVNYQRGVAEVDTWDHFINQDNQELLDTPDELAHLRTLLEESSPKDTEYVMRDDIRKE
jgi:hypothetical protein